MDSEYIINFLIYRFHVVNTNVFPRFPSLWFCAWFVAVKGDILEDPSNEPNKDMYMMSVDPEDAPDQPE